MSDTTSARLARVRAAIAAQGADALLVSQPENRLYLSGFSGSAGYLLIAAEHALLATDFRYYEQVGLEAPHFTLVKNPVQLTDILPDMIATTGARRIAFEADTATYAETHAWMDAAPAVEWLPTKGLVVELRATKDADELAQLRAAIALGDEALTAALAAARPGMTETELAWAIESYMRTHGATSTSFDIIVACGPNGARPHARASAAPLVAGEPIVIDMGATVGGYRSDLTRTVCFGQPRDAERFWQVYNTVLKAQMAAEDALRPGMTGPEADAVARQIITEAGFGDFFGHGLGHGVGLAIHERPRLGRLSTDVLAPGQVVTVEPGIYLPDWGGVRIEDCVLITENGAEVLTRASKDPILSFGAV